MLVKWKFLAANKFLLILRSDYACCIRWMESIFIKAKLQDNFLFNLFYFLFIYFLRATDLALNL